MGRDGPWDGRGQWDAPHEVRPPCSENKGMLGKAPAATESPAGLGSSCAATAGLGAPRGGLRNARVRQAGAAGEMELGGRQSVGGITDTARGFGIRGRDHGHGTGIVGTARGDRGHGTGIADTALGGSRTRPIPNPPAHPRPAARSEHGVCRRAAKHTQKASHYPLISALPAPAINTRAGCCC